MRKTKILCSLVILMFGIGITVVGCKTKKELISFVDLNTVFNVVGYAKPAPFSQEPNYFGFLKILPPEFISDQIDNITVFSKESGELCVIYKTINGEHILVCGRKTEERKQIISPEELFDLAKKIKVLKNLEIQILSQKVVLNGVECVLLNWRSGGINIFSFKQFREGLIASFSYKNLEKADLSYSGKIIFTEWDRNDENWPEIKELRFPLKD